MLISICSSMALGSMALLRKLSVADSSVVLVLQCTNGLTVSAANISLSKTEFEFQLAQDASSLSFAIEEPPFVYCTDCVASPMPPTLRPHGGVVEALR